jgi:hypothetical protein
MNFVASHSITAAMTRPGPSLPACQSPPTAVRASVSQPGAQNFEPQPGHTGNPGAIVDPHSGDGRLDRTRGAIRGTVEEHVARGRQNPKIAKLCAFYAAGAGFRDARPAEHCPFDQPGEDELRETWFWFYRIQAAAARKARPATPLPAEFRKAPRRVHHSKRVVTTSAAYAEQLGVEPVEGES